MRARRDGALCGWSVRVEALLDCCAYGAAEYAESGKAMVEHLFKLSLGMDSRVEDICTWAVGVGSGQARSHVVAAQSVTTISSSMKSIFNSFDEMVCAMERG